MTGDEAGRAGRAGAVARARPARRGAVRHLGRVPATRRAAGAVGVAPAAEAAQPPRRAIDLDLVGTRRDRLVDRRPLHDRRELLRRRCHARLRRLGRDHARQRHVLRRLDLLHERRVRSSTSRSSNTDPMDGAADAAASPRPRLGAEPHRLVGDARCSSSAPSSSTSAPSPRSTPSITSDTARHHVWRPDVLGSICFLVASELAFAEVGHRWLSWLPHLRSWWIAALNLAGSVAFGVSAAAAYVVPDSGQPVNAQLVNLGTFVGAARLLRRRVPAAPRTHRSPPRTRDRPSRPPEGASMALHDKSRFDDLADPVAREMGRSLIDPIFARAGEASTARRGTRCPSTGCAPTPRTRSSTTS